MVRLPPKSSSSFACNSAMFLIVLEIWKNRWHCLLHKNRFNLDCFGSSVPPMTRIMSMVNPIVKLSQAFMMYHDPLHYRNHETMKHPKSLLSMCTLSPWHINPIIWLIGCLTSYFIPLLNINIIAPSYYISMGEPRRISYGYGPLRFVGWSLPRRKMTPGLSLQELQQAREIWQVSIEPGRSRQKWIRLWCLDDFSCFFHEKIMIFGWFSDWLMVVDGLESRRFGSLSG